MDSLNFKKTMKLRKFILENPSWDKIDQGDYVDSRKSLRPEFHQDLKNKAELILPILDREEFEMIDDWHFDALLGIFASELATGMQNNIPDFVGASILPNRYRTTILPHMPARSFSEIRAYILSFENSSKLMKNVFAKELRNHIEYRTMQSPGDERKLILHKGEKMTEYTDEQIVARMLERGNITEHSNALDAIIDLAFPELLFGLRHNYRFSISSSSDHSTALATPVDGSKHHKAIQRIQEARRRLTSSGEVLPSWREYLALVVIFLISSAMLLLGVFLNWADRSNVLERVFDGTGLFSITAAALFAFVSRRLDFYDLLSILLQKKRRLQSYSELLEVLQLSDSEVKPVLTFEDVYLPPISAEMTSYAFRRHEGSLKPFSGLNSNTEDINIIVGNESAISRGKNSVSYFSVQYSTGICYLVSDLDAKYRIVTDGNEKIVH